ncbi:HDIG domain-containing protein [Deltaproteobacteria bacterium OttesenSCG-928-K17]|nr:HDIG domain-containing protein [Deltaproteobacteria bacterium OttesenSCG-928-K17]
MSRHSDMTRALSSRVSQAGRKSFFRNLGKRLHWLKTRELVAQVGFIALLSAVVVLLAFPSPANYEVGDVAEYTIRADQGLRVEDTKNTERLRRDIASKVPPVFDLDDALPRALAEQAAEIFRRGRELFPGPQTVWSPQAAAERDGALKHLEADFARRFNIAGDDAAWAAIQTSRFSSAIERQTIALAMEVMGMGYMDIPNPFAGQPQRAVSVKMISSGAEYLMPSAGGLFDRESALRYMDMRSRALQTRFASDEVKLIVALSWGLIQPNLMLDVEETERRVNQAIKAAPTTYLDIRAGEVIIREGSVVTQDVVEKLAAMQSLTKEADRAAKFLGLFLAMSAFFNASLLLAHVGPKGVFKPVTVREQLFLIFLLILVALMAHISQIFGSSLAWDFDFIDSRTVFYAMPIPAATMAIAILFGPRKASVMALFAAVVASAVTPGGGRFLTFLYCYNGAIVATWCLRSMNERGHLISASFWVMVMNCLTFLGLALFSDAQWSRQTIYNLCAAAASGAVSGIIASGLVPLIEAVFGFSTNFKLLELGNLDRPMLRELMLSAPGTYHHSVIVGAMVEAAAEAIGANPHLAKVGAYYHDIGKMKKPLYFVENQTGENRHDTLAPSMSALILIGHVRDGAELAREAGLPQNIIDIVEQHHGTSLMSFFYHKAKQQRQEGQLEVNEGDYRYPGPRPRSKEAGLVMMADICEAATRSLSEPTPVKIQNMVRQLINQIFNDGQLNECRLRASEIAEAGNTFTNILIGIYHHRVAYPGAKKAAPDAAEKTDPKAGPGAKSEPAKEIYGHLPVEPSKSAAH